MSRVILLLFVFTGSALAAKDLDTWDLKSEENNSNIWSDYTEAKPDIYPDGWIVSKPAKFDGNETQLRSNAGLVKVVLVNFSMMDMIGDDQSLWAALLGHEVAHLKLSHGEKIALRALPISLLKKIGKSVASNPLGNATSGLFFDSVGASFSRKDEAFADYMGVIWAIEAGFDPFGAVELHKRMNDSASKLSIPFLNDHPSDPERIKALKALATRLSSHRNQLAALAAIMEPLISHNFSAFALSTA